MVKVRARRKIPGNIVTYERLPAPKLRQTIQVVRVGVDGYVYDPPLVVFGLDPCRIVCARCPMQMGTPRPANCWRPDPFRKES